MQVYTIPEVAKLLKAAPITVKRLLLRGELNGFKVGSNWRVTDKDLEAFIEANRPRRREKEKTDLESVS